MASGTGLLLQPQKMHTGEPVSGLVFNPFLGKVVAVLENQHLDHEYTSMGLSHGVALLFPFWRAHVPYQDEMHSALPGVQFYQRITYFHEIGRAGLYVEKLRFVAR